MLFITLFCQRTLSEDKLIGQVSFPVLSLFVKKGAWSNTTIEYPVSGTTIGKLYISFSFGEIFMDRIEPSSSSSDWEKRAATADVVLKVTKAALEIVQHVVS
ncbi:Unknown protein [Striga hermonthica]|uniref:Uncharacterized protein n=1 Tax=Striga hermonthica TaxID=68872 RepID=A0A9N7REV3_STRHE|nr:Unknown protein [Striga hermonthica]